LTAAAAATPTATAVPTAATPAAATPTTTTPAARTKERRTKEEAMCLGVGGNGGSSECEGRRERDGYPA